MAIVLMDGLDLYGSISDTPENIGVTQFIIDTNGGRFGGSSLRADDADAVVLLGGMEETSGRLFVTFAINGSGNHDSRRIISIGNDSSRNKYGAIESSDALAIYYNSTNAEYKVEDNAGNVWDITSAWPSQNSWHIIEFGFDVASATSNIVVRIDTQEVLNETGDVSGITTIKALALGAGFGDLTDFDDFIVYNDSGNAPTSFIGDRRIVTLFPNGDGDRTDYTPANSGSNFEEVDEQQGNDGDTSYNTGSTVGNIDLFTFEDLPFSPTAIDAIQVTNIWRKDGTDQREASAVIKSGTTLSTGSSSTLSTSYTENQSIKELNPDTGSGWTETDINNLQVGYEITS